MLQDLDRLDELLSRANRSLGNAESDRDATGNRRRDERRNVLTEIVIVQPTAENTEHDRNAFAFVLGQTLNLSVSGVAFVTPGSLDGDSHLALLRHPDFPATQSCFELTLFRSRELADGQWEHGAVLRPLVPGSTQTATGAAASEV